MRVSLFGSSNGHRDGLKSGSYLFDGGSIKSLSLSNAFLRKDADELAKTVSQSYRLVAWAYRCTQERAHAVSSMPFVIHRLGSDEEPPDAEIPWKKKLKRHLWLIEASLCLFGRAYLFRRQNYVKTLGLQFVLATTVREKYDKENGITGFKRMLGRRRMDLFEDDQQTGWYEEDGRRDKGVTIGGGQGEVELEPHELIWFHLPDPLVEVGPGRAPAAVALESSQLVRASGVFATKFFERQAIPLTLIQVKGNPTDEDKREMESNWKRMLAGVKNAWKVMAIGEDVKPIVLGSPIRDLGMPGLEEGSRRKICVAFGLPSGLLEDSPAYASARENRKSFYSETIIPECDLIQEVLNDQLLNDLGYGLKFTPEQHEIMQEDEVQRAGALLALRNAGIPLMLALDILGYDLEPGVLRQLNDEELRRKAVIDQQAEAHLQQQLTNLRQQELVQAQAAGMEPPVAQAPRPPAVPGMPPGGYDRPQGVPPPPGMAPPPLAPPGRVMLPRPSLMAPPGARRRRRLASPQGGPQSLEQILTNVEGAGGRTSVMGNQLGRGWEA